MTPGPDGPLPARVTSALLEWGRRHLRDLPWRQTRDPWAVLVSEVMAQQTQVARVVPKWQAFLSAYPMPAACAQAPLGDVLRLWHGLGYPRRAASLHNAARAITAGGGAFPDSLAGLQALPGVGPYTARAVLAFAFERDVAVVDTNVARVLARVSGRRLRAAQAQTLADSWVPAGEGWRWNQSLMELGALRCRPVPACAECPLAGVCAWAGGGPGPDPAIGSAGVSVLQARFEGSDRQARGRLMAALQHGSVDVAAVPELMGRPATAASQLIDGLRADGLIAVAGATITLP